MICRMYLAFTISHLWGYYYLSGTKPCFRNPPPLMLNHVDIKVFPWLTRHDICGNIQPRSKMELVKGLYTTTNSQTEEGTKRGKKKKFKLLRLQSVGKLGFGCWRWETKTVLCRLLNGIPLSFQFIVGKLCLLSTMAFNRRHKQQEYMTVRDKKKTSQ